MVVPIAAPIIPKLGIRIRFSMILMKIAVVEIIVLFLNRSWNRSRLLAIVKRGMIATRISVI